MEPAQELKITGIDVDATVKSFRSVKLIPVFRPLTASTMKKLLKILMPPFVGFSLYFLGVRYSPDYFDLNIGLIGKGTLAGFMAYYKLALPLLFAVAVLTQLLIIIPIWRSLLKKSRTGKILTVLLLAFICAVLAAGMSYASWDTTTGRHHLLMVFEFMTAIQWFYWLINLFILYLLE